MQRNKVDMAVGSFLILSSLLKTFDLSGMLDLLLGANLGFSKEALKFLIVLLSFIELGLGLGLFLKRLPRVMIHGACLIFLSVMSACLAHGYFVLKLRDCGCLGAHVKIHPLMSIGKNAFLASILFYRLDEGLIPRWKTQGIRRAANSVIFLLGALVILASLGGLRRFVIPGENTINSLALFSCNSGAGSERALTGDASNLPSLSELLTSDAGGIHFEPDRFYFVPLYSLSCGPCMKSVATVNQLTKQAFPESIALAVGDEDLESIFVKATSPEFPLYRIPRESFSKLIGYGTPRFLLLKGSKPIFFWDTRVPTAAEVAQAIAERKGNEK